MNIYQVTFTGNVSSDVVTPNLVLATNFQQATNIAGTYAEGAGLSIAGVFLTEDNLELRVVNRELLSSLNTVL